jgi:hypothetical protein
LLIERIESSGADEGEIVDIVIAAALSSVKPRSADLAES